MKVDGELPMGMGKITERIVQLEAAGFNGAQSVETGHDPFLPLMLAAEHSKKIELITAIAVAFARNPMNMAAVGNDLNDFSQGRFIMGIGSQIKAHIEKRFSMPWSHPAPRMREMILAMRAIWANWYDGVPLNFRGEFYSHTLMTPVFTPTPSKFGAPRVFLAAVGPMMTEVAADVADGIMVHPMTSVKYLKQMTLPIVDAGLKKRGRARNTFELSYPVFIVSGQNEKEFAESKKAVKQRIAFYGSTPAYRGVLDMHGWSTLQPQLNLMSKQGKWVEMGDLIDDEMLDIFAVVGEPYEIVPMLKSRYSGLVDRFSLSFGFVPPEKRPALIRELAA
ncbi:MAG: TIGR03617 family F420-dependent LLM class oxidoreductase [Alphaproteobacteria bacterium]|nr:TIGR03617 family F420-dependent LLM class oxidoreductase [Alphaproteobacteria bacterium]